MRKLDSFTKEVLIKFIARQPLSSSSASIAVLEEIERDLRVTKLLRECDEFIEARSVLIGKADQLREYLRLDDEWVKRQEELDKLLGLTGE